MSLFRRPAFALLVSASLLPLAGCDLISGLFDQDVDLPIELESPPQEFDVSAAVTQAEGSACPGTGCDALTAICATEAGRNCTPPSMPAEFPGVVDVGGEQIDANTVMDDMGITEATELEIALPVDVGGALADQGVSSPDAIKSVVVENLVMVWPENELTFDTPPLDLYVSSEDLGDGALDAEQLIADGSVTKVGTIASQTAGSTDDAPVDFVEGGQETFSTAVTGAKFTIVTAVPDGEGLTLKVSPNNPDNVLKPTGRGTVGLKATLVYSVSAADIVGAASGD